MEISVGVTEAVDWRDVLSSGLSFELKALKLRDPNRSFWWLTPER